MLSEFGLSAFAAVIGFSAGAKAVAAIQQQGVALLIAGAFVTLIPMIVALCFGRFATQRTERHDFFHSLETLCAGSVR